MFFQSLSLLYFFLHWFIFHSHSFSAVMFVLAASIHHCSQTSFLLNSFLVYYDSEFLLSLSYEFQNDVLILAQKPESEKPLGLHSERIYILTTRDLKTYWSEILFFLFLFVVLNCIFINILFCTSQYSSRNGVYLKARKLQIK